MKRRKNTYVLRILVLISTLMLMMLLCGCRTRITNNTEVGNVLTDENGILQESYQIRRDELGIPVAESPLFNIGNSGEDEENWDEDMDFESFDTQESDEYDEDSEDNDVDADDDSTTNTSNQSNTTNTTPIRRPSQHVVTRPSNTTQQSTTVTVRVSLDPNGSGAKCSKSMLYVKKGSTYGSLPTPTRSGYDFQGWYTAKTKGKKVTSKTKVTTDKAHTLYARWAEIEKKTYTVTFDGNGEEDDVTLSSSEMTVTEDGKYGDMPSAKRDKYSFKGWYTDPSGGSQITAGSKFTANKDQTLYAHWEKDAYNWWKGEFSKAANEIDEESMQDCIVDTDNDSDRDKVESLLDECKGRATDPEDTETTPAYIIKFIKSYNDENAMQAAEDLRNKYIDIAPEATIIIASNTALFGEKEEKLLYKMKLFDTLHPGGYNMDEAEYDLLNGETAKYNTY